MKIEFTTHKIGIDRSNQTITGLETLDTRKGRYVYVIETPSDYSIRYQQGTSNVCYIGRQSERFAGSRIRAHAQGWIGRFLVLSQAKGDFLIHQCFPRWKGDAFAYRDVEAFLIREFTEKFGQTPAFNKRGENEHSDRAIEYDRNLFRRRNALGKIDARKGIDDMVDLDG